MANEIAGPSIYVSAWPEVTWGTRPTTSNIDPFLLPVEEYGIALQHSRRNNTPYLGQRGRKHGRTINSYPSGTIRGALHGYYDTDIGTSLAEFIINLGFGAPSNYDLPSMGCEVHGGSNTANKQHSGLRCGEMTISGSEDSGRIEWSGNFIGYAESNVTTALTVPDDLEKLLDFEFADMTFSIASSAIGIRSFSLSRNNNLSPPIFNNSHTPAALKCGRAVDSLTVQFLKNANTYDALARAMAGTGDTEHDIDIVLKGRHNGTGTNTFTRAAIDLPRCQLANVNDVMDVEKIMEQGLTYDVLKPDSSTASITFTWDTSS